MGDGGREKASQKGDGEPKGERDGDPEGERVGTTEVNPEREKCREGRRGGAT